MGGLNAQATELQAARVALEADDADDPLLMLCHPELIPFHAGVIQIQVTGQVDDQRDIRFTGFSDAH